MFHSVTNFKVKYMAIVSASLWIPENMETVLVVVTFTLMFSSVLNDNNPGYSNDDGSSMSLILFLNTMSNEWLSLSVRKHFYSKSF